MFRYILIQLAKESLEISASQSHPKFSKRFPFRDLEQTFIQRLKQKTSTADQNNKFARIPYIPLSKVTKKARSSDF